MIVPTGVHHRGPGSWRCAIVITVVLAGVSAALPAAALGEDASGDTDPATPAGLSAEPPAEIDGPAPAALAEREVFGFLPYWELGAVDNLDLEVLTTVAWFSVEAGADGWLVRRTADGAAAPGWAGWTGAPGAQLRTRAQEAGVRVVLTVERFAWDRAGVKTTIALLADPAARAVLVRDIVDSVTVRDGDGVNLDFEPLPPTVRREFLQLVRELRGGLDAVDPRLQLTFDLPPSVEGYRLKRLVAPDAADAVVLMGYEYRTAGSRTAGPVAPLLDRDGLDLRTSVRRALAHVPADRLILALPWYGRAWSTRGEEQRSRTRQGDRFIGSSAATYEASAARASVAGRRYERSSATAWSAYLAAACSTCPVGWRQLWYDDVDSVLAKAGFALRRGLLGVGIWALGQQGERPELWSALRFSLEDRADDVAPIGRVTLSPESVLGTSGGLPLVGSSAALVLEADDGAHGSGVAFVRIAPRGGLTARGSLRQGSTYPAGDLVRVAMPAAEPLAEVFVPGAEAPPVVSPAASVPDPGPRSIFVNWRDVAGNWSVPLRLDVYYDPDPGSP